MFALLLTHQLWPTSLGQNHMVALLLTHQLCTTSGDVRSESSPSLFWPALIRFHSILAAVLKSERGVDAK